jgi:hypothetical protein
VKQTEGITRSDGAESASTIKTRRGASFREWIAAVLTIAVLAGLVSIPVYRARLGSACRQTLGIPRRLSMSLDAIRFDQLGQPYRVMRVVKTNTFGDAVILITDDPADPPELRSISWCAYYLYPRVLVHERVLAADPELEADFVITTPHFVAGLPESVAAPKLGLVPLSDRAREYAKGWNP